MKYEFATSQRIIFESGALQQLPELAKRLGTKPALITGADAQRITPLHKLLKQHTIQPAAFSITGEPTTQRINILAQQAREHGCDYVIAFGGGSIIDSGKAIAALLTNTDELMNYLEVIGNGAPLTAPPAPCIAIPTTAGTGAEVTRNAVLRSDEHQVKVSMRHPAMLPTIALIDPTLTLGMPPAITAATGLDAFTQLLEAFTSCRSNPLTDGICRQGLQLVARALPRVYQHGDHLEAREEMASASLFGGLALANAGLGAVHGFAGPIGGMFKAPHGMVCACLLPATVRVNIAALEARDAQNPALEKYREMACLVTGSQNADLAAGAQWLSDLCMQLRVPGLGAFGLTEEHIPTLIEKGKQASSMKGNPLVLTDAELRDILESALQPSLNGNSTVYS